MGSNLSLSYISQSTGSLVTNYSQQFESMSDLCEILVLIDLE